MRRSQAVAILSLCFVLLAGQSSTAGDTQQQRAEVLQWLNGYVGDELLLRAEDLSALIEEVSQMSESEFENWYRETRALRTFLKSPEFQATRAWLREFLAVQAMYTEQEIDEFRTQAAKMSPKEMLEALRNLQRRHRSMVAMNAATQRSRERNLSTLNSRMWQRHPAIRQATGAHSEGLGRYYSSARPGPVRVSYAERMEAYRRPMLFWYGFGGWGW